MRTALMNINRSFFYLPQLTVPLLLTSFLVFAEDEAITGNAGVDELMDTAPAIESIDSSTSGIESITEEMPSVAEEQIEELVDAETEASETIMEEISDSSFVEEIPTLTLLESEPNAASDSAVPKDMVLVLDNSGSMKKNDPQFLTNQAVTGFIEHLNESTRLAIVIFDQDVDLAVPFLEVNSGNRSELLASLDSIDYKGLFTDSPAAIERAIYELKSNGRQDAQKIIVFMTDGIVDTGKADVDLEKAKWLKQDLAADAAENEIKMFGVAFTEAADFQLIQSLAQQTQGEYYRALKAEDLDRVFEKIQAIINKPPEPEPVIEPIFEPAPVVEAEPTEIPEPVVVPPPAPVIIEVPVQVETEDEKFRSILTMAAIGVMSLALIAILFLLIRRSRSGTTDDQYVQEAFLNDVHGHTSQTSYKLGSQPTMLGRVDSKEKDNLNHIVIPQSTIGRRHAMIEYKDYGFWIMDQGSINGTYINDKVIEGETRLKHGDRIRLHKFEFEFSVPELEEDGMTQISNTVFAGGAAAIPESEDVTIARGISSTLAPEPATDEPDFDLDMTGDNPPAEMDVSDFGVASETGPQAVDEYMQPEDGNPSDMDFDITGVDEESQFDSEDATSINPNTYEKSTVKLDSPVSEDAEDNEDEDGASDETIILHDDFDDSSEDKDDDATIRRSSDDDERFKETDLYPTDDS